MKFMKNSKAITINTNMRTIKLHIKKSKVAVFFCGFFALLICAQANAFDLCAEKNTTNFQEGVKISEDFRQELTLELTEKYIKKIAAEKAGLEANISAGRVAFDQLTSRAARLRGMGVTNVSLFEAQAADISKGIGGMVASSSKYTALLNKVEPLLKGVQNGAGLAGVLMDSVEATCNFKKLYAEDKNDWMSQLTTGSSAASSSLSVIVSIGSVAGAIPGPWSFALLATDGVIWTANTGMNIGNTNNDKYSEWVTQLDDTYIGMFKRAKLLANKYPSLPQSEIDRIMLSDVNFINLQANNVKDLAKSWLNLMAPAARQAIIDNMDNLLYLTADKQKLRTLLIKSFDQAHKDIASRVTTPLPTVYNVDSKYYGKGIIPSLSIRITSADVAMQTGGTLTVRAETVASSGVTPSLIVRDQNGKSIGEDKFQVKISSNNGLEQWQYQRSNINFETGKYTLTAKFIGPGNTMIESLPIGLTVGTAIAPPAPLPVISSVQPQGEVKLNALASMVFIGQNLNTDVDVALENCIKGVSKLTSSNQISHQCTPVAVGQQKATWRVNGGEQKNAGTVNVVGNSVSPTDGMAFKGEETIPDGSVIPASGNFTKTWTLHNTGTSTWDDTYCLRPASGDVLASTLSCVAGKVAPNGSYVFAVPMKAPMVKPETTIYKQYWALSKNGALPFGTKVFVEIKVNGSAPPAPPMPIPTVTSNVNPNSVQVGQSMTFSGKLSSDTGVSKVELLFPKYPNMAEAMTSHGGGQWSRTRTMQTADTAPYQVRVTMSNGQTKIADGSYTVTAANVTPPISPVLPPNLIVTASTSQTSVAVGQSMTFLGKLSSDVGVSKVELLFPKYPNTVETMTSNGGGQWSRTRTMQTVGTNAPFQVKVTQTNGKTTMGDGTYTVTQVNVPPAPPVPPTPPVGPNIQSISPSSGVLGQKVRFTVTGAQLAPTIKLQLTGEQCSSSLSGDTSKREFECSNNSASSSKQLTVTTLQGVSLYAQSFTVTNTNTPPSPPPPSPDLPINLKLVAGSNITAGIPWTARLTTSVPIYSADIIFNSGKRIPLDGDATSWESRDINSKFSEAAVYSYTLQIRRRINSQLETYPGGTLEVRPAPIVSNAPRITSALTSEQGKPYNLTVQTSSSADRVTVQWPDASGEQGLGVKDAQRTQWEYGNRVFLKYDPITLVIKVYKDGLVQSTGQTTDVLMFTPQAASIQLLEIAKNIVVGENRYVTVEASLAVAKVTFQLGSEAPYTLTGGGPGSSSQSFRAQVPFKTSGAAVPYTITGYNAQGQAVGNRVTGTIEVKAAGDSLKVPNPIPAEINKGQSVSWQFQTTGSAGEMWMEFAAPINRQNLNGFFLNHVFNYPAGSYAYKLMRKDYLGNVYAIGGASGMLRIKDVQVTPPPVPVVPVPPPAAKPVAPVAPAPVVPVPAPKPSLPVPAISNLKVEPGSGNVAPVIKFDVAPAAARATVKLSGRTFEFACSAGTQIVCNYTGGLNVPKGTFTVEAEAFNANGQSSGAKTGGFTR